MLPRHRKITFSTLARVGCLLGILLLIYPLSTRAEKMNKVVCRENLFSQRRDELAGKLRKITGWSDLMFDRAGTLQQGNKEPVGGSRSARELVARAIYGSFTVLLEDASRRSDVAFSRVVPINWKHHAPGSTAFLVQIDFADFQHVMGDERALEAFDVGWGLLHELDHIINDSPDAIALGEAGECEAHINQMRRECNLAQRADYFFTLLPLTSDSAFMTRLVRLAFEQQQTPASKKKRYWLVWDAELVGGLEPNQIAALR